MSRTDDVDLPPKQPETGERKHKKPRIPKPRQEAANEPRINTITNPENPEASIDTRDSATSCDEGQEVLIPLAEVGEPTEVNPREHVIPQEVQEETSDEDETNTPPEETPNKPQESGAETIFAAMFSICAIMLALTKKPPMKPQEMKVRSTNADKEIISSSPSPQREPNNTTTIQDSEGDQLNVTPNPYAPNHCTEHATVDSETPSPTTDPPSLDVIRLACPNNNLCVDGSILGTKCSFLIDTGASISAVKAQVWRDLPPPTKHPPQSSLHKTIRTVNGQPIPVLGEVELPFEIQSEQYPFTVLILHEMPYDAILGRDFLERYRAKIDLETHSLDLSLNSLPFPSIAANSQEDPAGEVTTHAHSSFLLPPESETVVPATVEGIQPGSTGLVHPNPDLPNRYGIIAATALVKVTADGTVPIRLLNPASQPVLLYRRTTLGTFTPTDSTIATFELGQADAAAEAARDVPTATDSDTQPWPNLENSSLDAPQTDRLRQLLLSYKDVFAFTPDQLGRTSVVKHTIDTGDNPPIRLRAYRTAPNGKAEIDKQIGEMLDTGVISPSVSPWAAPVVLVKKSDGTMRFCVDYRKLNDVTRKDSHPLPRIAESLDALGGARYFSTLDLRSGYWQIEMAADSKEKTAFITHNGLYEFNVLPFGLCNSPATFQRLMTHLMRGLEWSTCLVYIDDLIIFSRSFDDHLQHLEEVFKRLRDANVRLKPSKCHFVKPEVDYLGHLVSASGLRPNPDKIRAVQQFPTPRNVTDVRSFLGLANYYRRFIKGFAQIATPLMGPTGKELSYYPSALMVSHQVLPLLFFNDTSLMNVATDFDVHAPLAPQAPPMTTNCSLPQREFYRDLLSHLHTVHQTLTRVLALPAVSNLLECDTHLQRLFTYSTGEFSTMVCPRVYRPSLADCKHWALEHCKHITFAERLFLSPRTRRRRSSWMCHAGLFGLFRKIYESTGHACEPNHITNLKTTLSILLSTLRTSQSLIHTVNGKLMYVVKTTDSLTSKVNDLSHDAKVIEATFSDWETRLNRFLTEKDCHDQLLFEFLARYSGNVNNVFTALVRLTEIQDTLRQLSLLAHKQLFDYSMLPPYLEHAIHSKLIANHDLVYTTKALQDGFPVLLNPMVDIEHLGEHVTANFLFTIPEIPNLNSFCSVQFLAPIKFQVSTTCYTGPVTATNLAIIQCPASRKLVTTEMLNQCFHNSNAYVCPSTILNYATNTSWLGFPYSPNSKFTHPRHHTRAPDCENLQPLIHLGGRSYLATTTMTLMLSTGPLQTSPLTIYDFPCNVTFHGMTNGLGTCPDRISLQVPLLTPYHIQYTPWNGLATDAELFKLHHESLKVPPPATLNHSILDALDATYHTLDGKFTTELQTAEDDIDAISESQSTTPTEILAYLSCILALLDLILIAGILRFMCRRRPEASRNRASAEPSHLCDDCARPIQLWVPSHQRPFSHMSLNICLPTSRILHWTFHGSSHRFKEHSNTEPHCFWTFRLRL